MTLHLICPHCAAPLSTHYSELSTLSCPCGLVFAREAGVWRMVLPERAAEISQFTADYEAIRTAEGRGSDDPAFYRALPHVAAEDGRAQWWRGREQSFAALLKYVVEPMGRPLVIADLGAGNGWLAYQLTRRGHEAVAVDLLLNEQDGLGAHRHYDHAFPCFQAEFDHLPFAHGQFDVLVFNASFHYTADPVATLAAVRPLLRADGVVVIMDTPIYSAAASGAEMVRQRAAQFQARYGHAGSAAAHIQFLTFGGLERLGHYRLIWPVPAWRRAARRVRVWLGRQREPGQFPLVVLER
ncbi:MAG: class I SAM-dependent methyltransferase [Chloroflexi bacterium]|nr:class I SAM-dependent methyltransferase [Chloroflexota bacterium]